MLSRLGLSADPEDYHYTDQGKAAEVQSIDDSSEYAMVMKALTHEGFSQEEKDDVLSIIAVIMHVGQLQFEATSDISSKVTNKAVLTPLARLLGVPTDKIEAALTHRTIVARTCCRFRFVCRIEGCWLLGVLEYYMNVLGA